MFKRLSSAFSSLYSTFSSRISSLFSSGKWDEQTVQKLEKILLEADTGVTTTNKIIKKLEQAVKNHPHIEVSALLTQTLNSLLKESTYHQDGDIIILVGINGGGKTTTAAKLAYLFQQQGHTVLLAAADTFRAAAVQQLKLWADRLTIPLISGVAQQDPSSVVFQACTEFKKGSYTKLIIDTAGRLQTKTHLMKELEKIQRTLLKQLPEKTISTLLVLDSMLGQNSLEQAKLFNESTQLQGVVLTKTDGTGKGGIVLSVVDSLKIPIAYVTFGEDVDQISSFDSNEFSSKITQP